MSVVVGVSSVVEGVSDMVSVVVSVVGTDIIAVRLCELGGVSAGISGCVFGCGRVICG